MADQAQDGVGQSRFQSVFPRRVINLFPHPLMSPSKSCSWRKFTRRFRKNWSLAYEPEPPPYRRSRWQPPGKLFDLTVIAITVIVGFLAIL